MKSFVIESCSMVPSYEKKENKSKPQTKDLPSIQHSDVHVPMDEEIHLLACLFQIEVSGYNLTRFNLKFYTLLNHQ